MRLVCLVLLTVACGGPGFTGLSESEVSEAGAPNGGGSIAVPNGSAGSSSVGGDSVGSAGGEKGGGEAGQINAAGVDSGGTGGTMGVSGSGGRSETGAAGTVVTAGTSGAAGAPDVNECENGGGATMQCDGLCGAENHPNCSVCGGGGLENFYVLIGSESNPTNQKRICGCPDFTMSLTVAAKTCTKFTVQPGATVEFTVHDCVPVIKRQQNCVVASGRIGNTYTAESVHITRPSQNAWIHGETASLITEDGINRDCPLSCP